jgi:hypothetical protein
LDLNRFQLRLDIYFGRIRRPELSAQLEMKKLGLARRQSWIDVDDLILADSLVTQTVSLRVVDNPPLAF